MKGCDKKMKKEMMFMVIMALVVVGVVSAEINISHPKYLRILDEFDKDKTLVPIMIEVSSEDVREEVIASLTETEFKLIRRLLGGTVFVGEITKNGLDKLVNNPNIRTINFEETLHPNINLPTNDTIQNEDSTVEKEIKYNWLLWLGTVILIVIIIGFILKTKRR